jgi:hypothetical protein
MARGRMEEFGLPDNGRPGRHFSYFQRSTRAAFDAIALKPRKFPGSIAADVPTSGHLLQPAVRICKTYLQCRDGSFSAGNIEEPGGC